jgi:hypothetical protein
VLAASECSVFLEGAMSIRDVCPNCRQRVEILFVKFRLAGVQMISACPNCAMISDEPETRAEICKIVEAQAPCVQPPLQVEPARKPVSSGKTSAEDYPR